MGFILSSFIKIRGGKLCRSFDTLTRQPAQSQEDFLQRILQKNKDTVYGKKHSFSSIKNRKEFQQRVPLVDYTDIEPYVDRIKLGEKKILTEAPVFMFSLTSGTTSRPKYIPITREGQRRTELLMQQWLARAITRHPAFLDKHFLGITGAAIEGYCRCGIPFGSASGMVYTTLPNIVRQTFAAPFCTSEIADYDIRYYVFARFAFAQPLSFIATPSPLTLAKLTATAHDHAEEIIRSVHNGWLSPTIKNENDCRTAALPPEIMVRITPDKSRAAFLTKVMERTGSLSPVECWPHLTLIGCWLGGSIGFHTQILNQKFGNISLRDIGYMASEGCMTLPVTDGTSGGILALQNHYYEFIPESQLDSAHPDILTAAELREGCSYNIILTNENGLYRYDINDIIHVDGFYHRTPVISFIRKSANIISIAGEKLHVNHIIYAINRLQSERHVTINQFRAVPDFPGRRYELFLDLISDNSSSILKRELLPALDHYIGESNIEYAAKRKSKRLRTPRVHIMHATWVEAQQKKHEQFGKRDTQYKWVQLSPTKIDSDYRYITYTIK